MRNILSNFLLMAVALPAPIVAATPDQRSEVYGDWVVRCVTRQGLPPCDALQSAKSNDSGEQVMQISLAYAGKEDRYGAQIMLPLGILIQGGILVRLGEKTDIGDFKFTRCEAQGCFAERMMTAKDMQPFLTSGKGIVAVMGRDGKALVVPVSLKGVAEAVKAMIERNRQWAAKPAPGA